jgi:diaminohydroxyphosphoribosylaminopyrimidine deaminase/5-amino-6-(5-phosphoribosylamino)uracil reductase
LARRRSRLSAFDALFFERALELAARGAGNTSPNPVVGAVIVRDGKIAGEGYHHRAGEPHAEVLALRAAAERSRGATAYVTLEPCDHFGLTPPCSQAIVDAGIVRVVVGCADPNPITSGAGIERLRRAGIDVCTMEDSRARDLIEPFAWAIASDLPYVALKIATSVNGYVAERSDAQRWLTGEESRTFVRVLRARFDAVLVGAGTVRSDDPQLTVRPPRHRLRPYVRVVACETAPVEAASRIFIPEAEYSKTIVLAPAARRTAFRHLEKVADVAYVGAADSIRLELGPALRALRERNIYSVLCEGGPTLATRLVSDGFVKRFYWLVAPVSLDGPGAVPGFAGGAMPGFRYDGVERLGPDMLLTGKFVRV